MINNKTKLTLLVSSVLFGTAATGWAGEKSVAGPGYDNMFIAYVTPQDVKASAEYAGDHGDHSYILWTLQGDMPYSSSYSLLKGIHEGDKDANITGYWTDWSVYTAHARSINPYPIPGSLTQKGQKWVKADNKDMSNKLDHINTLSYAFLEAQSSQDVPKGEGSGANNEPPKPGQLYFNDPWSDLSVQNYNGFCQNHTSICSFAYRYSDKKYGKDAVKMGNFDAFVNLKDNHPDLKTAIAIGGYGHNDTFEETFKDPQYMDNFINSAMDIVHFSSKNPVNIIEMDYEDPNMSWQQSRQYYQLLKKLNDRLDGTDVKIDVDVLADPAYITGQKTSNDGSAKEGFDSNANVLQEIADLSHVRAINLMTYDFHGAFDYDPDKQQGQTGFLSNLYRQPSSPQDDFSIETSLKTLKQQIGDDNADKAGIGVPAYGRGLAGIQNGETHDGHQTGYHGDITPSSQIPGGDLDAKNCSTDISHPFAANSCAGMFTYRYIVDNFLESDDSGFKQDHWFANGEPNATTAFAKHWQPNGGANYSLELTNTGQQANGDLGFELTISNGDDKFTSGYLGPGADRTLDSDSNNSVKDIEGDKDLTINYQTYSGGPSGQLTCTEQGSGDQVKQFDFKQPTHVMVKVDSQGNPTCEIAYMK